MHLVYKPLVCCNSPHLCDSKSLNSPVWLVRLEYYEANYSGLCGGVPRGLVGENTVEQIKTEKEKENGEK